jgi:hypothetical protein
LEENAFRKARKLALSMMVQEGFRLVRPGAAKICLACLLDGTAALELGFAREH